jgi:hypothetical protein
VLLFTLLDSLEIGARRVRKFYEGPGLILGLEALDGVDSKAGKKAWGFHGQDLFSPAYLGDFSIR